MADGVGPASWAPRRDIPELDGHGNLKIIPMASSESFVIAAGRDPRGKPVVAGDGEVVGEITDMWVDAPEQLVRYLQIELNDKAGTRLMPMTLAKIKTGKSQRLFRRRETLRRSFPSRTCSLRKVT